MTSKIINFNEEWNKRKETSISKEENRITLIWRESKKNEYRLVIYLDKKDQSFIEKLTAKLSNSIKKISKEECKNEFFDSLITQYNLTKIADENWDIIEEELAHANYFCVQFVKIDLVDPNPLMFAQTYFYSDKLRLENS